MATTYRLRTDGAARGNPGPAGIGVVLEEPSGEVLAQLAEGIGWTTNNVAEYTALIRGLELAKQLGAGDLVVFMDSTLVVRQMRGEFKVKHPGLKPLHARARALLSEFESVDLRAVRREQNSEADLLANQGIDQWLGENPDARPPESPEKALF